MVLVSRDLLCLPLALILVAVTLNVRKTSAWTTFASTTLSAHVSAPACLRSCWGHEVPLAAARRDRGRGGGSIATGHLTHSSIIPCHYHVDSSLRMMAGDGDTKDRAPLGTELGKNMGSYYRRPSAAIERGGGFFVPGLQGSRLRLVFGGVMLGLLSLDGLPRPGMPKSQLVSITMAAVAGLALVAQGLLDQRKEQVVQMRIDAIAASSGVAGGEGAIDAEGAAEKEVSLFDTAALGNELDGRMRWAADILLQLTPACTFVAFSKDKVLARVGVSGGESDDPSLLAMASARAASIAPGGSSKNSNQEGNGDAPPPLTVTVARGENGSGNKDVTDDDNDSIMSLLPDVCRQGILCSVEGVGGKRGRSDTGVVSTVLLGSSLAGTGVFSARDTAWYQRVCVYLALSKDDGWGDDSER